MIMDNEQQKIDVRISDIIVSIAPAAIRTLIGVTSSLGTLQVRLRKDIVLLYMDCLFFRQLLKMKKKKSIRNHIFNPKPFKDAEFLVYKRLIN